MTRRQFAALASAAPFLYAEGASRLRLTRPEEPGEPLVVSGIVYRRDRRTPASGVTLYFWQTDAKGIYGPAGSSPKDSARLRGRLVTGADGRYELVTIRPGHYPGGTIPAHIHVAAAPHGAAEQTLPDFLFEGDPFLSAADYSRWKTADRFSGVLRLQRDSAGVWRGERDIALLD